MIRDLQQIVAGGFCIGCGACHAATHGLIPIRFDDNGCYQADIEATLPGNDAHVQAALFACPFSNEGPDEDEIGCECFGAACLKDVRIGYYKSLHVGHVSEGAVRKRSASGGILTWVLCELLRQGVVDGVAHVHSVCAPKDGVLFRYGISRTPADVMAGAKSRYYPVEMSGILSMIRKTPGRYAVVGLPCFVKAVRRLQAKDPELSERIDCCVGLVCGHLKSRAFADCFGWQAGIAPGHLDEIDFRVKLPGRNASQYGVMVAGEGIRHTQPSRDFFGSNWGYGFFKYSACDYCDDVFAETADIAVGDAWLPDYLDDDQGNSIVVARSPLMATLLQEGCERGDLVLDPCSPDQMAASQAGGLRHRREGLACRLADPAKEGEWLPRKRSFVGNLHAGRRRQSLYRLRERMREESHTAWRAAVQSGTFTRFAETMQSLMDRHDTLSLPVWRRIARWTKARFRREPA